MLGTILLLAHYCFEQCLWNIPTPLDQVLDGCIVHMHVKIDTLCEQRWPPEQQPGKKSGHMLYLLCHQGPLRTVCMQQDSDYMCLWPDYHLHHDTTKHSYSGVVKESTGEWNGILLSSFMKVGSVCMKIMDVHMCSVDLMWWLSVTICHIWCFCRVR